MISGILCKYISLPNLSSDDRQIRSEEAADPGLAAPVLHRLGGGRYDCRRHGRPDHHSTGDLGGLLILFLSYSLVSSLFLPLHLCNQCSYSIAIVSSSVAHNFDLTRLDLVFVVYFFFTMMLLDNTHPGYSLRQYRRSAPPVRPLLLHHGLLCLHSIWQVDIVYHW